MGEVNIPPPNKGGTKPKSGNKIEKSFLHNALPMWLQNLAVLLGMALTIVTTWLAVMAYNAQVDIKGMKEILASFKPNIIAIPKSGGVRNDSLILRSDFKNNGTRTATDIKVIIYVISGNTLIADTSEIESITYGETLSSTTPFVDKYINKETIYNCGIVYKVVFRDQGTNELDSTKRYIGFTRDSKFALLKPEDQNGLQAKIKELHPSF